MELLIALGVIAAAGGTATWRLVGAPREWARRCQALGLSPVDSAWRLSGAFLAPDGWEPPPLAGHFATPHVLAAIDAYEGRRGEVEILVAREPHRDDLVTLYATLVPDDLWWWGRDTDEAGELPAAARASAESLLSAGAETVLVHGGVLLARALGRRHPRASLLDATAALGSALTSSRTPSDWPVLAERSR